jgi:hypothetical protein
MCFQPVVLWFCFWQACTDPNPHERKVGVIVRSLFAAIVVSAILAMAMYYYKRRKQTLSSGSFVRVTA